MSTEERLRKVTIGEPTTLNGPITLADYDPEWPLRFDREAKCIRAALGERVLLLEHVGSTAVPGLVAKPIIDIILEVADSSDEAAYVPDIEATGYVLHIREPDWHEHRLFKGPKREVNLHVFGRESSEIRWMLLFRDRLRADRAARDLYARSKKVLAQQRWTYVQDYADAKTQIIDAILGREDQASGAAARSRGRSDG